jgi:hypothetical protein
MNCPYCLSEVSEEAVVCKTCTRDLYMFKSLMHKVEELELQLSEIPNQDDYENRIAELESMLNEHEQKSTSSKTVSRWFWDITLYLLVPLLLLLLAHWLITVVYDAKIIYLRIVSMVLPLPFAYMLFKERRHRLLPWFIGVAFLAISSVIGMSWITSQVDHSSVLPQTLFDWKELIEYSASIAFSFLTGMLLGGAAYARKQKRWKVAAAAPLVNTLKKGLAGGQINPRKIHSLAKLLDEYGSTIVAFGTTSASIYTGLKGIIGL